MAFPDKPRMLVPATQQPGGFKPAPSHIRGNLHENHLFIHQNIKSYKLLLHKLNHLQKHDIYLIFRALNWAGRRDLAAPMFFETICQVTWMFVIQAISCFFDRNAIAQEFIGLLLALFEKPSLGCFAHARAEIPLQGPQ